MVHTSSVDFPASHVNVFWGVAMSRLGMMIFFHQLLGAKKEHQNLRNIHRSITYGAPINGLKDMLGGGFKYVFFSSLLVEDSHFD